MYLGCLLLLVFGGRLPPLPHSKQPWTRQSWERLSLCWFGMLSPSMKVALGPVNSDILSETVGPAVPECPAGLLAWPCPRGVRASGGARPTVLDGLVDLLLRVSWSGTPHCLALNAPQSIFKQSSQCRTVFVHLRPPAAPCGSLVAGVKVEYGFPPQIPPNLMP